MAKYQVADIRNICFCGHGTAGKTTLIDRILTTTGVVTRPASVDEGTSICDFDEEEKHHKYTIEAKLVHFEHAGKRFNVFDTPGYPDYVGQAIGALRGVDTAVIVINAQSGIGVNTRRMFAEAAREGLGRIIVLDRMDADNIDFAGLVANIRELFGKACTLLNVPLGQGAEFRGVASTLAIPADTAGALVDPQVISQSLLESIIEVDEQVMERYFEGTLPSEEERSGLIVRAVAQGSLIPVVCVSGKTGAGLAELLDTLALCGLAPDRVRRTAKNAAGAEVELQADPAGPLAAQVFKTRIDPFVQKLSFIRIFSGTLKTGDTVQVVGIRRGLKFGQLFEIQADETEPVDAAGAGQIVAVTKVEDLRTGMSLGELALPPIPFPAPMVGLAVTPKSRGDEAKVSAAMQKLAQEDSTFRIQSDPQTKEMVATGMSELHLLILRERLKRRDKVEIDTKEPKIPYRETIQINAEGSYRHKKQTGGRGQFGEVHIRMFPLPKDVVIEEWAVKARFPSLKSYHYDADNNFVWIDSVVGGTIPSNFMPAVEKGFYDRLQRGVIAGYKVQNLCIEVHFGKHHPVDSSEQAFKTAASMAFRNVFQQAKPALLEPIVKIEITVPSSKVGDITSDMSGRRGRVLRMDSAGGDMQTVIAEVPLAEVTTYARALSSITAGQGSYAIEYSHYDVVPGNVQQEIIAKAQLKEEEEE
ncbi:MAG: elongation factor G [Thermoguttaceae bacterium]|jgi:elongation factor G